MIVIAIYYLNNLPLLAIIIIYAVI